jgi:predicted nucleic acid-binding protein
MAQIITPNEVETFSQASIYLDACFILAYLDSDHDKSNACADLIDYWSDEGVTLGISRLTFVEVTNRILQSGILGSIQVYNEHQYVLDTKRNGIMSLPTEERRKLIDVDAARMLYRMAKRENVLKWYNKEISVPVRDLLKQAKQSPNRGLLDPYYNFAVEVFTGFIFSMTQDFGFQLKILESDPPPSNTDFHATMQYIRLLQLEPFDALHLALANLHGYQYLATLDGDFVHQGYPGIGELTTNILQIA